MDIRGLANIDRRLDRRQPLHQFHALAVDLQHDTVPADLDDLGTGNPVADRKPLAGRRSAVINGQRLAIGDRVSGAEVIEIDRDRVVLEIDGESMELVKSLPSIKAPVDIRKTADVHPSGRFQRLLK